MPMMHQHIADGREQATAQILEQAVAAISILKALALLAERDPGSTDSHRRRECGNTRRI